jgi:hypothetical protein
VSIKGPGTYAERIVNEHCADLSEERKAKLRDVIFVAIQEWGDERYGDGLFDAQDND